MDRFTLGRQALRQIQALVRKELIVARRQLRDPGEINTAVNSIYVARSPVAGIAAMVADAPGAATCTVLRINNAGVLENATNSAGSDISVTAYNVSSSAVAGDTVIQLKQELATGKLLVDFEDCGGA